MKKSHTIERNVNKLTDLIRKVRILTEEETKLKKVPVALRKDDSRSGVEKQYEDRKAIVAKFVKATRRPRSVSEFFTRASLEAVDDLKEIENLIEQKKLYRLQDIDLDLTKLVNEMKNINFDDKSKESVERIQRLNRYWQTMKNKTDKNLGELQDKRTQFEQKKQELEQEQKRKLEELRQELGFQKSDEKKIEKGMQDIEKNIGDSIKEIRQILIDIVDAPIELLESAKIYINSLGATGVLSKRAKTRTMTQEGIDKILNDPKFKELRDYIEITPSKDKFQMLKVERTKLTPVIAELKLKAEEELDNETKEKIKSQVTEGVVQDVSRDIVKRLKEGAIEYIKSFKEAVTNFVSTFNEVSNNINEEIQKEKEEASEFHRNAQKFMLNVQKIVREDELKEIDNAIED